MKKRTPLLLSAVILLTMTVTGISVQAAESYEHKLFFASDYQGDPPAENLAKITQVIEEEGITPELAVWCGDYTNKEGWIEATDAYSEISTNIAHIKKTMTAIWPSLDYICLQGNHDNTSLITNGTIDATGAYEYEDYIIYAINKDDFPWAQGATNDFTDAAESKTRVEKTAQNLEKYLNQLIAEGSDFTGLPEPRTGVPTGWTIFMQIPFSKC